MQEKHDLIDKLFRTEHRRIRCLSVTFGKLKGSLTEAQMAVYLECARSIEEFCGRAASNLEAGDKRFRMHMQGMFEINIASAAEAQDWIKEYMQAVMKENEANNIRIHCRVRSETHMVHCNSCKV